MTSSPPETRASLILRLQDANDIVAWDEFAEIYAPVVYRSARRIGLQSADADDVVQEVLAAVARSVKDWIARSCLLYTSPSPRDQRGSRMPSSA